MSEILHGIEQPHLEPIDELRRAIDEIIDGNPEEALSPELQEKFAAAVAHVADKYGKTHDEMTQLVDTIMREES